MAIIVSSGSGVSSGRGTGAGSIAKDMYFATTAERDQFTADNPDRIYQGVTCAVVNGSSYNYFQYDETTKEWRDANLIFQGKAGVVQEIVAGDNVTVDNSNPTRPVISSTGSGAVSSVNGKTGSVVLNAEDVGAYPITGGIVNGKININADGSSVVAVNTLISANKQVVGVTAYDDPKVFFGNKQIGLVVETVLDTFVCSTPKGYFNVYHQGFKPPLEIAGNDTKSLVVGSGLTSTYDAETETTTITSTGGGSGGKDPSDGFDLKPDASIGLDSTSAVMIKNNAGEYHNAIDQDINLDAIRLGSQAMKTYLRTNEDHIQVQTSVGMKTIAHTEDIPTIPAQHQLEERRDLYLGVETYVVPETDLYKNVKYVGRSAPLEAEHLAHIQLPSLSTFEQYFWFDGVNDDKKDLLPSAHEYIFSCGWESTAQGFRISSTDGSVKVFGNNDIVTKVPNQIFTFQFVQYPNKSWNLAFSDYSDTAWVPYENRNNAYSGVPENLKVALYEGKGYQRIDRQTPVNTTDVSTPKFRLIRVVASEEIDAGSLPSVKMIQPPELGSGFSFHTNETDPLEGDEILQISSGTYKLDELGIDSGTVSLGDEVYVQEDGSIARTFSRYPCGWVISGGVIIDIDIYNAAALSQGGFPTDPSFNSVTTNTLRSTISPNNSLTFDVDSNAKLKSNAAIDIEGTTAIHFKVGGETKAALTSVRWDMNNTSMSNVADAILDYDVAGWKQIKDYVAAHNTPIPDDLVVNSVTAQLVKTPVIDTDSTKLTVDVAGQEVAHFTNSSLDLQATANSGSGFNVSGIYRLIGADTHSFIALPNENMVLNARNTVVLQDDQSDYIYVSRVQGLNFAGTNAFLQPDYTNSGVYLRGDRCGLRDWSGNDMLTVDKLDGDVINANNHKIQNLATPTEETDATTKTYVDGYISNLQGQITELEKTVANNATTISQLQSLIISMGQDIEELIESNKQSVTNFVMYSETSDTLRMDMDRIGGQGLTQTVQFGNAPVPPNPEPPLPNEVTVYYGWDVNEMNDMQAADFLDYQGTDERTANLYVTADTLMDTQILITRSDTSRYKYSYIAYPKGLVDPNPLKVTYSGFVDTWNHREMVIEGHTYIVLVPEYPNNLPTMDMKLSY